MNISWKFEVDPQNNWGVMAISNMSSIGRAVEEQFCDNKIDSAKLVIKINIYWKFLLNQYSGLRVIARKKSYMQITLTSCAL